MNLSSILRRHFCPVACLLITLCLLFPFRAHALDVGAQVSDCSSGYADPENGIQVMVCLYGDRNGLEAYVQVDIDGSGSQHTFTPAVAASGSVSVGNNNFGYFSNSISSQDGEDLTGDSVNASYSFTPQLNTVYTANGWADECYDPTGNDDLSQCSWYYGYGNLSAQVEVTVNKTDPAISSWPNASMISYGQPVGASVLSGGSASVSGHFSWNSPGQVLDVGSYWPTVVFTPDDTTDYNVVVGSTQLWVDRATPVVTSWPSATAITYGQSVGASALVGGNGNPNGTFSWSSPGAMLTTGVWTQQVTFQPADSTHYWWVTGSVQLVVNKATPVISWSAPGAITYGTALSGTQLNASSGGVPGSFSYSPSSGTVLGAGVQTLWVTFTPSDTANYNTVSAAVQLQVNKATPSISWPAPSAITYGTALSGAQLNAGSGGLPGSFSYSPSYGAVLGAGVQTLWVTFTPSDTANYNTVSASVQLQVSKATPMISWPTPGAITYGTALSGTQLNASSGGVAGSFSYSPAPSTVLGAGLQTLSTTFTPSDTADYNAASAAVQLQVSKATPMISWPTPGAITYGTVLSGTQLNASSGGVAGNFSYSPAAGTVLGGGLQTLTVIFTPNDTNDYNTATASVQLQVNQATPTLSLASSETTSIYRSQVTFTATISSGPTGVVTFYDGQSSLGTGTISGTTATFSTAALTAGNHSISATWGGNTNYSSVSSGSIAQQVEKATPLITWVAPASISYGTALSSTQLNASSGDISGSFTYSPAAGSVLGIGMQTLSVSFVPADTGNYDTASATVLLLVDPVGSNSIYGYSASYDAAGNVASFDDSVVGRWTEISYDPMNRLTSMKNESVSKNSTQYSGNYGCWSYDAFGNRTLEAMSTSSCDNNPTPTSWAHYQTNNRFNDTSQATGGVQYDDAGDVTNDGSHQYMYDAEGRICAVATTVNSMTVMTGYLYDAEGRRVSKGSITRMSCDPDASAAAFTATSDYVLGLGGEQVTELSTGGTWQHTNVWAGSQLLATYDTTGLHFYFDDPLGSRRAQTDPSGAVEQSCVSLPFGDGETCTPSPTEHLFTGKEHDAESGNDYFGARYYASSMGRFLSPDPKGASGHVDDPQTWNRYVYAGNNPFKFIDPDGLEKLLIIYVDQPQAKSRTIQIGMTNFGHAFVGLADTDHPNNQVFRGFYPKSKWDLIADQTATVAGMVKNDAGHDWNINKAFHITDEQYAHLMDEIAKAGKNPQGYNMQTFNCVDWVLWLAKSIRIDITTKKGKDSSGVSAHDPGDLGEDLRDLGGTQNNNPPNPSNGSSGWGSSQRSLISPSMQKEMQRQCNLGNRAACN